MNERLKPDDSGGELIRLSRAEVGRVLKNCTEVKVKVLVEIFTQVKVIV